MKDWNPDRRDCTLAKGIITLLAPVRRAIPRLAVIPFLIGTSASYGAPVLQGTASVPVSRTSEPRDLDESAREYEKLVREHPESAELWSNLGAVHAMAGNCKEALPALQRAESLNASLFSPWYFAGYCHFALHQSRQAFESLQRATHLNPRDANAWLLKAQVSSDLGNMEDSLEAVVRSQSLGQKSPEAYYFAGKDTLDLASKFYDRVARGVPQPEFYSLLLDGQRDAALGVRDSAINEYLQASKILPDQPDLHFAMGTAYLENGRYGEAENSLRHCLELAPHSAWARLRLTLTLLKQSKQAESLDLFRSISLDDLQLPSEYQDYLSCAYLLKLSKGAQIALALAQGRFPHDGEWSEWPARLASQSTAISNDGASSLNLQSLTGVGLSLRFYLTAKQDKNNIFKALFSSPPAFYSFQSDFLQGRWTEAAGRIAPLLKSGKQTDTPAGAFALGEILQSLSYGFYEQLGAEFPDSFPAMKLAAENFSAMGQQEKALEIYEGIVKRDGPSPDILREMARIYWTDHKWDQALEVLQPLAQMDPNDPTIFVNMGRIYVNEQKSESAAEAFRQAIRLEPKTIEAHLGLGQALRTQGDLQGALRESKIASEIDPSNPGVHYQLSQIYNKLGEKKLAAQEMESFHRLRTTASSAARKPDGMLVPLD